MKPVRGLPVEQIRSALLTAAACALLLFPLVAVRVDAIERTISWRWGSLAWAAAAVFALSLAWRLWRCVAADELPLPPSVRRFVVIGMFWRRGGAEGRSPSAGRSEHNEEVPALLLRRAIRSRAERDREPPEHRVADRQESEWSSWMDGP